MSNWVLFLAGAAFVLWVIWGIWTLAGLTGRAFRDWWLAKWGGG